MNIAAGLDLLHYRLIEKIGEGGVGIVWKALDTTLDREVAIKILSETFRQQPERLERFKREAKALAALDHPNIVTIHSIEREDELLFLTMELVRGRLLREVVPEGGLPFEQWMNLAISITDAVGAAHEHGITHRDLKPQNILVRDDGLLKVLDFGLAHSARPSTRTIGVDDDTLTSELHGLVSGTPSYMSPEQIDGLSIGPASDVFSLGIVLYEMATGQQPFRGESFATQIASMLRDRPRPLTELRPELPPRVEKILGRCLEKNPERRYPSAVELHTDLEQVRRRPASGDNGPVPTIAVLPFDDSSAEKDQDYFCEGIAEEIINALTRVKNLRVASRSSSFLFKEAALDSREIADRLGVSTLLQGSVRKYGNRLRITAELINAVDGYQFWSERYDRESKDIFAVQDEIAGSIVEALQVSLTPKERRAIKQVATAHPRAFDLYLRGRKFLNQYGRKSIEFAQQMFSRAIDLDPSYARAWAGVADCCAYLYMNVDHCENNRRRAEEASLRAIELDPDLAEVQTSRGVALSLMERFDEADAAFRTALQLDPLQFEATYFYARDCFTRGNHEKAIELYERACELRPEDYQAALLVAQSYTDLNRTEEATEARHRGVKAAEQRLELSPDDVRALYMGANGLVALGETERGLAWADRARAIDPNDPMLLYNLGCIYSLAGASEQALECLRQSVEAGFAHTPWIRNDSNLDPLREDPEFIALLDQLG
jgi:serine/threonine protein kinase/Flp pilus assembly protein TadD